MEVPMRSLSSLDQFYRDLRFGFRNLTKNRAFAALAVCSLALGIGASTAMFSVIYAVILDPFPYKDVDSLMSVMVREPGRQFGRSYYNVDQYVEIAGRSSIFDGVIASTISDVVWRTGGEPQRLRGNHCSTNTFEVMGVPALIGRAATPADGAPDAGPVVVLGYKFWQKQFGGDASVLGRRMELNGVIRTVIGVMPPRFMWRGADVYIPAVYRHGERPEGVEMVHVLGRLKPGVTAAQAEADLHPIIEHLREQSPSDFPEKWRVGLLSFKQSFPSGIQEGLWILFGSVGMLLLIACVNVSNLLLSKATERQQEMNVRASLGASRWTLVRQLLTESVVIAMGGGIAGILVAYATLNALISAVPQGTIPDEAHIAMNRPALIFALVVAAATAILFGLAPALHTARAEVAIALRQAGRGSSASVRQRWLRSALVIGEVALALMLLVGASLMLRTLFAMQSVDLGMRPAQILTLRIPFSNQRYPTPERRIAFLREASARIRDLPGVAAVGVNSGIHPLGNWTAPVDVTGGGVQDKRPVMLHQVNGGYLATFGISVVEGRRLSEQDVQSASHVAVVSQAFVKRYFPSGRAIGQMVTVPRLMLPPFNVKSASAEIVGVVKDTMNRIWTGEIMPEMFLPYTVTGYADYIAARTYGDPKGLVKAVRAQIYAVDPDQPLTDVETAAATLEKWVYARPRFNVLLLGVFAGLGLCLALVGVFGIISTSVSQRTREIGIRIALGAEPWNVISMVMKNGAKVVLIGIAVGLASSFATVRLLSGQLWKVRAFDPISFCIVAALMLGAGLIACLWPARRAATVDPAVTLKYE
jgi:predicted permease